MNVYAELARAARDWSARPAVVEGDAVLTYGALWREVEAMRTQLAGLGVGEGQGVGVLARNGRTLIVAALGALGAGGTVMLLHPQLRPAELAETLAAAPLAAVIAEDAGTAHLAGVRRSIPLLDGTPLTLVECPRSGPEPLVPWVPDAAFLRFTSGTTGAAKGVVLTHGGVLERVQAANQGLGLGPEDVVLWVLPMAYHFFVSIVLYLRVGAAIVVCPDHLARSVLDAAEAHRATFLYAAPLHVRLLAADASGRPLPASLRRVMSVSSPLASQAGRDFQARFDLPVAQGYGIIEVGLPVMNLDDAAAHPGSIGRALPGFEVQLLGEDLSPVAPGETGQLAVRGPGMFAGYLCPPTPRAAALHEGFFLTGDLAHRDAEGLLTIDGRLKSVINIAGHKVFPEEIAGALEQHPGVLLARVSMRPHPNFGEVVHAEVQPRVPGLQPGEVLAFCRRRLSGHKVPVSLDIVAEIPMTPSGKVRYG